MAKKSKDENPDAVPKPMSDISRPGKSKPSPTSRPIITTNHSLLKDPMMSDKSDDGESKGPEEKIDLSKAQAPVIKPLESPDVATTESSSEAAKTPQSSADAASQEDSENARSQESVSVDESQPAQTTTEDPGSPEDTAVADAPDIPTPETEASDQAQLPQADEAAPSTETPSSATPQNGPPPPDAKKREDEAKAAAKAKHDEAIQRLADSKKYELPIKSSEQRMNKMRILVIIAVVVLALAWLDLAMDAGIIHVGGLHAPTHFFSD